MARRPMMAANWKMNKTLQEAEEYMAALTPRVEADSDEGEVDVAVFAPFTSLAAVGRMAGDSPSVLAGAQNFYYEDSGAFTGEVSVPMLLDLGVRAVITGHSERREIFGETDTLVSRKTDRALAAGLVPVVCVGETKEERDSGGMWDKVSGQVRAVVEGLSDEAASGDLADRLVFAYEPVWAIGTGDTATPDDAQDAARRIRELLGELRGEEFADRVRILYGGSVKPDNVGEIMARDDVDGGLVGGASLEAGSFIELVAGARKGAS